MRVGIIGGGFGLSVQAPIIQSYSEMELIAVSTMKRHQLPKKLVGPIHYKNWMEMVDQEKLDLLFVSSLPIYHYEMVKFAIKKGISVVCEKPFTMNSSESKELFELTTEYKTKVIVDFEWRYLPIRQKMKDLIMNNRIGKILHIEYHISSSQYENLRKNKRGWMGEKHNFGGMLGALGTHMIDCIRWITKSEIDIVSGMVHTHVPIGGGEQRDADDAFFVHGKTIHNSTFSIQVLSGIRHGFGSMLKIFGTLGTITLENDEKLCLGKVNDSFIRIDFEPQWTIPENLSEEASAYFPAFFPFLEKVYDYVENDYLDDDLPTIQDGHQNQRVVDKIIGLFP